MTHDQFEWALVLILLSAPFATWAVFGACGWAWRRWVR